jgi:hypothetical protein
LQCARGEGEGYDCMVSCRENWKARACKLVRVPYLHTFLKYATGNGVMKASTKRFAKTQGTAPRPGEAGAQGESSKEGEGNV